MEGDVRSPSSSAPVPPSFPFLLDIPLDLSCTHLVRVRIFLGFSHAPVLFPRWFQAQGDGGGASPFLSSFFDWGGIGFSFGSVFHGKDGQDGSCLSTLPLGRVPIHPMVHSVSTGSIHHTRRRNVVLHGVWRTNPSALERNTETKNKSENNARLRVWENTPDQHHRT